MMTNLHRHCLAAVVMIGLASHLAAAKQVAKAVVNVPFDKTFSARGSGGKIEKLTDGKPALVIRNGSGSKLEYVWLKGEDCKGRKLKFSVQVKAEKLSKPFVFSLQASRGGKHIWPGSLGENGTFDWKPFSFTIDFGTLGIGGGAVRFGLQNTDGTVMFRDLVVTDVGRSDSGKIDDKAGSVPFSGRYGSIDFAPNRFHVPDYTACHNLIQNPSFEAGMDYWEGYVIGRLEAPYDGREGVRLDSTTAVDGHASICQEVFEDNKGTHPPATYAIPLENGKEYTLTFYAKTDSPSTCKFAVGGVTDVWDNFLKNTRYDLGTYWRRYTYHFKSPKKMVKIYLGCFDKQPPCKVWIDAVQLEKGTKATEFTRLPVAVTLKTNTPDNLSQPGEKVNARIAVSTRMPAGGSLSYTLRNFYGDVVDDGEFSFETEESGVPEEFAIPACDTLDSGQFVIQADVKLPDGFTHSTWHRLARMTFIDEPLKHKIMFSGASPAGVELHPKIGIGSLCLFNTPTPQLQKKLKELDIMYFPTVFQYTGWPPKIIDKYNLGQSITFGNTKSSMGAVKDEDIPAIVDHALKTMRDNPDCRDFKTINEPFCHNEEEIAKAVTIHKALRDAARKVNPDIRIMTPDCANLEHSLNYLDTFFRHGGADACDIVALHTYRGHPDAMDGDLTQIVGLTDKYKPGADIWSTEGGYYNIYVLPDLNFPHVQQGGDHFRAGNISYDMGIGERIALAYETRYRLQVLKYADRVKVDVDWNLASGARMFFGGVNTPKSHLYSVNVPARLLGNADYVTDLKLPKEMRGYLFKDDKDRPVATMWFCNDATLYKDLTPAAMSFKALAAQCHVFDVVGADATPKGDTLQIAGYPVFLRGKPGSLGDFRSKLEAATFVFPEVGPALKHTFELSPDGRFAATFANRFNRNLRGELVCKVNSAEVFKTRLELGPYGSETKAIQFPKANKTFQKVTYRYAFTPDDGDMLLKDCEIDYFVVTKVAPDTLAMDGDLKEWDGIPAIAPDSIQVGPDDDPFHVDTRWAWNEQYLYCAFDVKDSVFKPSETIQFPNRGDSVELYIDSFANAVRMNRQGYDEDDQSYILWFADNNRVNAYRRQTPNLQLAFNTPGRVADTKSALKLVDGGYRFELAFPLRAVKPVDLRDGGCFGMNLIVRNSNPKQKKRTAIFGSGEPPCWWRAPNNYVFAFLEDPE